MCAGIPCHGWSAHRAACLPWLFAAAALCSPSPSPSLICLPLRPRACACRAQMRAALLTSAQCATYDELKNLFVRRLGWEDNLQTHFTGAKPRDECVEEACMHACGLRLV